MADNDAEENNLQEKALDDEVFKQAYIPRTLNDVVDYERDAATIAQGKADTV